MALPRLRRPRQGRLRARRGAGLTATGAARSGPPPASGERGRYADAARDLLHERILDAVGEALRERSWTDLTMADIARLAGVSRQTLYNSFGSRPELAQAFVIREGEGFLAAVGEAVRANASDPRAALRSALEVFLASTATHPLVRAITAADGSDELLPLVTTRGGPLLELATSRLAGLLVDTWPQLSEPDAELVADTLVRLAISYAALPSGSAAETAESIARILAPSVDGLLGPG